MAILSFGSDFRGSKWNRSMIAMIVSASGQPDLFNIPKYPRHYRLRMPGMVSVRSDLGLFRNTDELRALLPVSSELVRKPFSASALCSIMMDGFFGYSSFRSGCSTAHSTNDIETFWHSALFSEPRVSITFCGGRRCCCCCC